MRGRAPMRRPRRGAITAAYCRSMAAGEERRQTLRWQDQISVKPSFCHGNMCIAGTWIMLTVTFDNLTEGFTEAEILSRYPARKIWDWSHCWEN